MKDALAASIGFYDTLRMGNSERLPEEIEITYTLRRPNDKK